MAVYTELSLEDANRLAHAHHLGRAQAVHPVYAGSVNSNFFIDTEARRVFGRIYEEQEVDGVEYEWRLIDHLSEAGIAVPARVVGPRAGAIRVAGKPTALFEMVGGDESCQALVSPARMQALGVFLASAHRATETFPLRRTGRFGLTQVRERFASVRRLKRPELAHDLEELARAFDEIEPWQGDLELPRGVIHGDLFRDNVRWEDDTLVAALDWESASDGRWLYDIAVCLLAWSYGAHFDWTLGASLIRGYESIRPLTTPEWEHLRLALMSGALRFTVTRITDYHLRSDSAQITKSYKRFVDRLRACRALDTKAIESRLRG